MVANESHIAKIYQKHDLADFPGGQKARLNIKHLTQDIWQDGPGQRSKIHMGERKKVPWVPKLSIMARK